MTKKTTAEADPATCRAITLALEFQRLAPWEFLDDTPLVAHRDPATRIASYCSILGAEDEVYGAALYTGDAGLRSLVQLLVQHDANAAEQNPSLMLEQTAVLLSFEELRELEAADRAVLRSAGVSVPARGRRRFPVFRAHRPGDFPAPCTPEELAAITPLLETVLRFVQSVAASPQLLEQLAEADERGSDTQFPIYFPSLAMGATPWVIEWIDIPAALKESPLPACRLDPAAIAALRTRTPVGSGICWQIGGWYLPMPVAQTPDAPQIFPQLVAIADSASGLLRKLEICPPGDDLSTFIGTTLMAAMHAHSSRPAVVAVAGEAYAGALRALCAALDVQLIITPTLGAVEAARDAMFSDLTAPMFAAPDSNTAHFVPAASQRTH